ncbi:nuclear transport factor 2 family protein [Streptomyces sp. NPDC005795]|uniref:nuclear transport factor 2 family protein n=1 Tax=Streptomyces sp. NPDC005795 TaxID=3154677 RepID=UPI0033FCDBF0
MQDIVEFAEEYFDAAAAHHLERYLALFDEAVVVRDDGRSHHGLTAVRRWHGAGPSVRYTLRHVTGTATACQAVAEIRGDFPGSPVDLRFTFERDQRGKITLLDITA